MKCLEPKFVVERPGGRVQSIDKKNPTPEGLSTYKLGRYVMWARLCKLHTRIPNPDHSWCSCTACATSSTCPKFIKSSRMRCHQACTKPKQLNVDGERTASRFSSGRQELRQNQTYGNAKHNRCEQPRWSHTSHVTSRSHATYV